MNRHVPLPRSFYERDPRLVAPDLLNKVLATDTGSGRIVEVEAYCGKEDPAAHSYRGLTKRNATMFGPAGHLYVYFIYGMHWCANVVCGKEGEGSAVLIRALEPLTGIDDMLLARPAASDERDLCSGPAKLCQALGLNGKYDGADLVTNNQSVMIFDDATPTPAHPTTGPRIGISQATNEPWRWTIPNHPHLSRA